MKGDIVANSRCDRRHVRARRVRSEHSREYGARQIDNRFRTTIDDRFRNIIGFTTPRHLMELLKITVSNLFGSLGVYSTECAYPNIVNSKLAISQSVNNRSSLVFSEILRIANRACICDIWPCRTYPFRNVWFDGHREERIAYLFNISIFV